MNHRLNSTIRGGTGVMEKQGPKQSQHILGVRPRPSMKKESRKLLAHRQRRGRDFGICSITTGNDIASVGGLALNQRPTQPRILYKNQTPRQGIIAFKVLEGWWRGEVVTWLEPAAGTT